MSFLISTIAAFKNLFAKESPASSQEQYYTILQPQGELINFNNPLAKNICIHQGKGVAVPSIIQVGNRTYGQLKLINASSIASLDVVNVDCNNTLIYTLRPAYGTPYHQSILTLKEGEITWE